MRDCANCGESKEKTSFNNNSQRFIYKDETIVCDDCVDLSRGMFIKYHKPLIYNRNKKIISTPYDGYQSKSLNKFRIETYKKESNCEICNKEYKDKDSIFSLSSITHYNQVHFCWECKKQIAVTNNEYSYKLYTGLYECKMKAINSTIKQSFGRCGQKAIGLYVYSILKCSSIVFKHHIEKQFTKGMNWENHSLKGWHFDHIEPISRAKTIKEAIKLNHYTNFQPLWAEDNIRKSNKF